MTRVIWNTPLGAYTSSTLAEIRAMKTHGEKRVRAILEVFHAVHALVAGMGTQDHLVVRIVPRLIDRVEQWIGRALQRPGMPGEQEIFANFVQPLLEQIRIDATQQIATLAENRLGIGGPITSVRQAARTMGLTRARVYQLLNEINDIMTVRWPTGRHQVARAAREVPGRSGRAGRTRPICGSSTRPSSCSIPAAAAARPARWNRPSTPSSKRTNCSKCPEIDTFTAARSKSLAAISVCGFIAASPATNSLGHDLQPGVVVRGDVVEIAAGQGDPLLGVDQVLLQRGKRRRWP